jgi:hypothetical protein
VGKNPGARGLRLRVLQAVRRIPLAALAPLDHLIPDFQIMMRKESHHDLISLFEHDPRVMPEGMLFGKPVSTLR